MPGYQFWTAAKLLSLIIALAIGITYTPTELMGMPFIRVIPAMVFAAVVVFVVDVVRVLNGDTHEFEVPFMQAAVIMLVMIVVLSFAEFVSEVREVVR